MITKYELRIGNLILCGMCKYISKVHEIKHSAGVRVLYTMKGEIANHLISYSDCQGILITEEILELCGFMTTEVDVRDREPNMRDSEYNMITLRRWEMNEVSIVRYNDQFRLFTEDEDCYYSRIGRTITCLHELQNCYYGITGLDIDISPILNIPDNE